MHKVATLSGVKAGPVDGLAEGEFVGYASVFGNVDSYGEVVDKGAFAKSLAAWAAKGDPIPLLWSHDLRDVFSHIGSIVEAVEDDHGLRVRGVFDLDGNPTAAQVYRLAKSRRVTGMSFAFNVLNSTDKDGVKHLTELDLIECSIVPLGANPEAGVIAAKDAARELAAKAGRVISAKNEETLRSSVSSLKEALGGIQDVLSALGDGPAKDEAKSQDETTADAPEVRSAPSALVMRRLAAINHLI